MYSLSGENARYEGDISVLLSQLLLGNHLFLSFFLFFFHSFPLPQYCTLHFPEMQSCSQILQKNLFNQRTTTLLPICLISRFISSSISIFLCFTIVVLSRFSHVWLCATLWTAACQDPLSMGFFTQEYWSGLPFSPPYNCYLQWFIILSWKIVNDNYCDIINSSRNFRHLQLMFKENFK